MEETPLVSSRLRPNRKWYWIAGLTGVFLLCLLGVGIGYAKWPVHHIPAANCTWTPYWDKSWCTLPNGTVVPGSPERQGPNWNCTYVWLAMVNDMICIWEWLNPDGVPYTSHSTSNPPFSSRVCYRPPDCFNQVSWCEDANCQPIFTSTTYRTSRKGYLLGLLIPLIFLYLTALLVIWRYL